MSPDRRSVPASALQIQRVTVRTGVRAGKELTPRCSVHNDCSGITGG